MSPQRSEPQNANVFRESLRRNFRQRLAGKRPPVGKYYYIAATGPLIFVQVVGLPTVGITNEPLELGYIFSNNAQSVARSVMLQILDRPFMLLRCPRAPFSCLAIIVVLFIVDANIMDSGNVDDHWGRMFLQEARRPHTIRTGQDVGNTTPSLPRVLYI